MATGVQSIIDRVRYLLMDEAQTRWTDFELLAYLNDGQREICNYKPDAATRNTTVDLVAGTRQAAPSDSIRLLTVIRNNSSTHTSAVRAISRETLDRFRPNWHGATASAEVQHFIVDENDMNFFYVYPPNDGNGQIEVLYTKLPSTVALADDIDIADAYSNVLADYVAYRALSKDADVPSAAQRATGHYQAFTFALSGKQTVDSTVSPSIDPVNVVQ